MPIFFSFNPNAFTAREPFYSVPTFGARRFSERMTKLSGNDFNHFPVFVFSRKFTPTRNFVFKKASPLNFDISVLMLKIILERLHQNNGQHHFRPSHVGYHFKAKTNHADKSHTQDFRPKTANPEHVTQTAKKPANDFERVHGTCEADRAKPASERAADIQDYRLLGLTPSATKEEIIAAHRKGLKANINNGAMMAKLNATRDVLLKALEKQDY